MTPKLVQMELPPKICYYPASVMPQCPFLDDIFAFIGSDDELCPMIKNKKKAHPHFSKVGHLKNQGPKKFHNLTKK